MFSFANTRKLELAELNNDLLKFNQIIERQFNQFPDDLAQHLRTIHSNGKQLRPMLALLTAGSIGKIKKSHHLLAAIIELIHLGSLIHDDVIDDAAQRRNKTSLHCRFSNTLAILVGDKIFSQAVGLTAELGSLSLCKTISKIMQTVCEGEITQNINAHNLQVSETDYLNLIYQKTGILFGAATSIASSLSRSTTEVKQKLTNYGHKLGSAYQIYDDCLDLIQSTFNSKTLGTDLTKGKITLPIIRLLNRLSIQEKKLFKQAWKTNSLQPLLNLEFQLYFKEAVQSSIETANQFLQEASQSLSVLDDSIYLKKLRQLNDYLSKNLEQVQQNLTS